MIVGFSEILLNGYFAVVMGLTYNSLETMKPSDAPCHQIVLMRFNGDVITLASNAKTQYKFRDVGQRGIFGPTELPLDQTYFRLTRLDHSNDSSILQTLTFIFIPRSCKRSMQYHLSFRASYGSTSASPFAGP